MNIKRLLSVPNQHFFLFGPRGCGKSFWLKDQFQPDLNVDLLKSAQFLELSARPEILSEKVTVLPMGGKVVIDEVQKLPIILDEVHSLIFEYQKKYQFALTGSSARKLKRGHANMLAGRAIKKEMFPFVSAELGVEFKVLDAISWGTLPNLRICETDEDRKDFLYTYVETYLREEIQMDAAVRNLPAYNRFLKHAAIMNGQTMNLSNISREAGIPRSTLDGYYQILQDTLLGTFLEPIHLNAKVKEVSTPKFYFFDCGVVRALRHELGDTLGQEKGFLLETLILNEMRAYSSYFSKHLEFFYWATPSHAEVDFIVCKGKTKIAIEVKSSGTWKKEFNLGLHSASDSGKLDKLIGVYLGIDPLVSEGIEVWPLEMFLNKLFSQAII
jgi:predicted AAA+ superfamily ATPase